MDARKEVEVKDVHNCPLHNFGYAREQSEHPHMRFIPVSSRVQEWEQNHFKVKRICPSRLLPSLRFLSLEIWEWAIYNLWLTKSRPIVTFPNFPKLQMQTSILIGFNQVELPCMPKICPSEPTKRHKSSPSFLFLCLNLKAATTFVRSDFGSLP